MGWLDRIARWAGRPRARDAVDWLIVGLGNPGPKYEGTRHSVGREVVRAVARQLGVELDSSKFNAVFGTARVTGPTGSARAILALPLTYMNESGQAVAPLARFFQVPPDHVIAVYDDMDLPVGVLRVRPEGGSGGNRGTASVIRALGTEAFPRIRVGIGRPPPGWESADYVLSRFGADERSEVERAIDRAVSAALSIVQSGVPAAMNEFN